MKISMKEYNLDYFQKKDIYTWEEIISILEDMEGDIVNLNDEINYLKNKDEIDYEQHIDWEIDRMRGN